MRLHLHLSIPLYLYLYLSLCLMCLSTSSKVLVCCALCTENAFGKCVKKKKACGSLKEKEGIGGGVHDQFEALYISLREGELPHSAHVLQISAPNYEESKRVAIVLY